MTLSLPETGFLRLADVLKFIPISKAAWYQGIRGGIYPKPIKISKQTAAYRAEDIRALIEKLGKEEASI